tara:strand:- start:12703 stop:13053 length:351 start_codon:yes stop_codon:yes gene_type:complete
MAKNYIDKFSRDFKNLCSPAFIYLFISVVIFIVIAVQNFGNTNYFCVGSYNCYVPNTFFIFLFDAIYILFWTFILNSLCKAGYSEISWILVILPIILFFIILGLIIFSYPSIPQIM